MMIKHILKVSALKTLCMPARHGRTRQQARMLATGKEERNGGRIDGRGKRENYWQGLSPVHIEKSGEGDNPRRGGPSYW